MASHDGISESVEKLATTTALTWEICEDCKIKRKEGINLEGRFRRVDARRGPIAADIEALKNAQRELFWLECALNPFPLRQMEDLDKRQVSRDLNFFFLSGGMFLDAFYQAVISSLRLIIEAIPTHSMTLLDV